MAADLSPHPDGDIVKNLLDTEASRSPKDGATSNSESSGNNGEFHSTIPAIENYNDLERDILCLETQIRTQKETSMNAKTAITFDQLKKIHAIARILGPSKDAFYDRICRAADIQRASLKNRLKQNKEKFRLNEDRLVESPSYMRFNMLNNAPPALKNEESSFMMEPITSFPQNSLLQTLFVETDQISSNHRSYLSTVDIAPDEKAKIPAQRMLELLQLGFSYEELKQVNELYYSFAEVAKDQPVSNVREQFSNFLSTNATDNLRLVASAFSLLEMGYTARNIHSIIHNERRKRQLEELEEGAVSSPKRSFTDEAR